MFYDIGSIGRYIYVFDSDDNSCELVKSSDIKKSGVVLSSMSKQKVNIHKLAMLYNLGSGINNALGLDLCSYSVGFNEIYVDLVLRIILIYTKDLRIAVGGQYEKFMYDKWDNKFVILLNVEPLVDNQYMISATTPILTRFEYYGHQSKAEGWGTLIPLQMMNYILNLAKMHDLKGIMSAMCGLYSDELTMFIKISDKRNGSREIIRKKKRTIGALNEGQWYV